MRPGSHEDVADDDKLDDDDVDDDELEDDGVVYFALSTHHNTKSL